MREFFGRGAQVKKSSIRATVAVTLAGSVVASLTGAPSAQALSKQPTDVVVSKLNVACEVLTRESDAVQIDDAEDLRGIVKYLKVGILQIKKYDRSVVAIRPAIAEQKAALSLVHKFALANVSELTKLTAVATKGDDLKFLLQAEAMTNRLEASRMKTIDALEAAELPACDALLDSGPSEDQSPTPVDVPTVKAALLPTAVPAYQLVDPTADERSQIQALAPAIEGTYSGITLLRLHDAANTYTATIAAFEFLPAVPEDVQRRSVNIAAAALDLATVDPVNGFDVRFGGPVKGLEGPVFKVIAFRGPLLIEFTSPANAIDGTALRAAATAYLQAVPAKAPADPTPVSGNV